MKLFPARHKKFRLYGDPQESIERLKRRTEFSDSLTSSYTDKSFRGIINGSEFKLISSTVGRGAFCVMSGAVSKEGEGVVYVRIHKAFRILLSIIFLLPVAAVLVPILRNETFNIFIRLILAVAQVLIFRYVVVEIAFRILSKESLKRLRDVLDADWIED